MSKDIVVLTPNGRRQKIHCTPDTSILQILEEVCQKQGFQPSDYNLKHHNHVLDLTTTIRFTNLPNKAMLEMVEAEQKRQESNVTIGLQLEDGDRKTADFSPNTSLYDLVISLAPGALNALQQPTILYMRQEVVGETALREKTLRQLGLIKGRAILRLLNKSEEARQANVSAVYRCPITETKLEDTGNTMDVVEKTVAEDYQVSGPSEMSKSKQEKYHHEPDIITKFKESTKQQQITEANKKVEQAETSKQEYEEKPVIIKDDVMETETTDAEKSDSSFTSNSRENLERRLKIEEEVTFLGDHRAIAFMQPDYMEAEIDDLPDDFYELSVEEVRKLYHELQQHRLKLENTPLLPSKKKDEQQKEEFEQKLKLYNNVVVRVQFPDRIILQGIFSPLNTIEDVNNFIKQYLRNPHKKFLIFITPLKETFDPKMTLLDAKFVPCVHMHFKWLEEDTSKQPYLKDEVYTRQTEPDAASILASKYRAPSRRKPEDSAQSGHKSQGPSTSKSSKMPKWFK